MKPHWLALALCIGCAGEAERGETVSEAMGAADDPMALALDASLEGPGAVVDLLLGWDSAGLRSDARYDGAFGVLTCVDPARRCERDEPGFDHVVVVNGYRTEQTLASEDSAQFSVLFDEAGIVWQDGMEDPVGSPPLLLTVRRIDGYWRIVGSSASFAPRLSPDALLRQYSGLHPDSAVLAQWLAARR